MESLTFLREVMEAYLASRYGISESYRKDMRRSVRMFEEFHGRQIALVNLNERLLGQFLAHLYETHAATSTNNRRRHLLTLWLFAADEYGALPRPRRIPKLQEPQRIPEAWTLTECEQIFTAAARRSGIIAGLPAGSWWLAFLLTVYWTGERVGAIRKIRSLDYDPVRMSLRIRPETQKTKKERMFFLPPEIHSAIAAIHNPARELLFPWDRHPRRIWPYFQNILKAAGIKHEKRPMSLFHKLRRTSGTLCELNGGSGSRHLGNTDAVFRKHYFSPNLSGNWQAEKVPLPHIEF